MSSPCSRPCHRGRGAPRSSRYTSPACRPARSGSGRTVRQLSQFLRMPTDGPPPHGRGTSKVENEASRGELADSVVRAAGRHGRQPKRSHHPRPTQRHFCRRARSKSFAGLGVSLRERPSPWSTHSVPFASSRSTAFPSVRSTRTLPPSRPSSTSRSSVVATHRPSVSAAIATGVRQPRSRHDLVSNQLDELLPLAHPEIRTVVDGEVSCASGLDGRGQGRIGAAAEPTEDPFGSVHQPAGERLR